MGDNSETSSPPEIRSLRIALLHDWLFHMRGGEKCLRDFCELFPNTEIFTLFHDEQAPLDPLIRRNKIHVSVLNRLPAIRRYYRLLLPLFGIGTRSLKRVLEERHAAQPFDLVISISHCAVKNIHPPKGVRHICYCLTPARYLWDQFERYVRSPWKRVLFSPLRMILRSLDQKGARAVDTWVGISHFIAERIQTAYGVKASVIYPAVDLVPETRQSFEKGDFFLVVNELVPYKNTALIVEAFNALGLNLVIIGKGPEEARLRSFAGPRISFRSNVPQEALENAYRQARALIFAAEEDFGMTPIECQSAGTPVICLQRGGALETVAQGENKSGLFFQEATAEAIGSKVNEFLKRESDFSPSSCRASAARFNKSVFQDSFIKLLNDVGILENLPLQVAVFRQNKS